MKLIRPKEQILTKKQINDIKQYAHFIDIGSEVSCYNLTSKQVIKFFDMEPGIDTSKKLFIADNIYGTETFIFVDAIQKYCNKIISYTMKYISGARLGKLETTKIFYELTYTMLLEYLEKIINDSKSIANNGIQAFDCFENNIILSPSGFKQIDCVDFILSDTDPYLIEKENIKLMCQTIWDSLIGPYLSTFIINNNLKPEDFTTSPYEFMQELKTISQKYSDNEIITLEDTKKLSRRK